jgi:putative transposase
LAVYVKCYPMNITYKSNNNIVYSFKYHIVWCPKYRKRVLVGNIEKRLKQIIKNLCKELDCELIEIECDGDHIHLLVEIDPQFGVNKFVKLAKGRSSNILRQEFETLKTSMPSLWTNSYFVSTVGGSPLSAIKKYIENQKTRYEVIKENGWNNNGRG